MNKSKYLQKLVTQCNEIRTPIARKTRNTVILLAIISIVSYVGLPLLDSRATSMAVMFSATLGFIGLIFLIKFIKLNGKIGDNVLMKCEQEIQKNLNSSETFETFDDDMTTPTFGEHLINESKIIVGQTFVLFQRINNVGPSFHILRVDNLGEFDVHYFTEKGVGSDIGVDIKDKNGKFIRSIMTQNKDRFYEVLDALEKAKNFANGDDIETAQSSVNHDDSFVEEVKQGVKHQDRKNMNRLGIIGIIFGLFLVIAGSSSDVAFIYAGLALFVVSIIFMIVFNIKSKL